MYFSVLVFHRFEKRLKEMMGEGMLGMDIVDSHRSFVDA